MNYNFVYDYSNSISVIDGEIHLEIIIWDVKAEYLATTCYYWFILIMIHTYKIIGLTCVL